MRKKTSSNEGDLPKRRNPLTRRKKHEERKTSSTRTNFPGKRARLSFEEEEPVSKKKPVARRPRRKKTTKRKRKKIVSRARSRSPKRPPAKMTRMMSAEGQGEGEGQGQVQARRAPGDVRIQQVHRQGQGQGFEQNLRDSGCRQQRSSGLRQERHDFFRRANRGGRLSGQG